MRTLVTLLIAMTLASCAGRHDDGKRSDLEVWLLNLGQIAYDSAKQAKRPGKDY